MSARSGGTFDVDGKKLRLTEIEEMSNDPAFWNDQARSQVVLKERAHLERTIKLFQVLQEGLQKEATGWPKAFKMEPKRGLKDTHIPHVTECL